MIKYTLYISLICICMSCVTVDPYYTGTTGSRYGIEPFPSSSEWEELIDGVHTAADKKSEKALLWIVGTYYRGGLKLNFPGESEVESISFDNFDFNTQYLKYFSKKGIDVFLTIEPGAADINTAVDLVLKEYGSSGYIKGIAIDLEWYEGENILKREEISSILKLLLDYNENYTLIIKHWNINGFDKVDSSSIIYVQTMEGLNSIAEVSKRHKFWSRTLYPNRVGLELGFDSNKKYWKGLNSPITDYYNEMFQVTDVKTTMFWNEKTVKKALEGVDK